VDREIQLIRRVLGDSAFSAAVRHPQYDSDHFHFYTVDLPYPAFRGFPPRWGFAILRLDNHDPVAAIDDSYKLIARLPAGHLLLLISDSPQVNLEESLLVRERNIFCLNINDLPPEKGTRPALVESLRRAIRRRLSNEQITAFVPYQKNKPAIGWRFHGRKRELQQLLDSPQSFVIIGGRRIGKTSLMLEANSRLLQRGENTHYLSVEECRSASAVLKKLLNTIAPRDAASAVRRSHAIDESLLVQVLKQLTSKGRLTLFLDELGNVLLQMSPEDWSFFGVLRQFSHQGRLRFVMSCFQEFFLRQQEEFSGPLVNFAATMRLGAFSRSDIEEFVLSPLDFWRPLGEERGIIKNLVLSRVGCHPRFLQSFCYDLFEKVARGGKVLDSVKPLLGKDLAECFEESINEVFWQRNSSTLNYLFLRRCMESEQVGGGPAGIEITDDWVRLALRDLGYEAALLDRRNLLEGMELRGFTSRSGGMGGFSGSQVIVAPIIYFFFKNTERDLALLLSRLAKDIQFEEDFWRLRRSSNGEANG
jgi:hypothetical protein